MPWVYILLNIIHTTLFQQVVGRANPNQMQGQFGPGGAIAMGQVGPPMPGFNPNFNPNNPFVGNQVNQINK